MHRLVHLFILLALVLNNLSFAPNSAAAAADAEPIAGPTETPTETPTPTPTAPAETSIPTATPTPIFTSTISITPTPPITATLPVSTTTTRKETLRDSGVNLKVDISPAIYIPGKTLRLSWKIRQYKDLVVAPELQVVIHAPLGLKPLDPDGRAVATPIVIPRP